MPQFNIPACLQALVSDTANASWKLSFRPRPPILLANGPQQTLPVWALFGIYLLVERRGDDWDVDLDTFDGELLYVGMTTSNVHERLKSHFGLANMRSTFANHRWRTVKRVLPDLQERLGRGEVVLYSIDVDCNSDLPVEKRALLPEIFEKHLLLRYALEQGRLPVLNLQF